MAKGMLDIMLDMMNDVDEIVKKWDKFKKEQLCANSEH